MGYKKAIISLDIMRRSVFDKFNTFNFLQNKPANMIWEYYPKTGKGNYNSKTMFNEAPILETFLLLDYIKNTDIVPQFWYNTSLFIFNDDLYSIKNGRDIVKVDLEDTIFISMRESWAHPFFAILETILQQKNGKLTKPNKQTMINTGSMNKFFALKELYKANKRKDYIGDFILPFNIKQNEINVFIDFIKQKMGNKIVMKYDGIQEGKGVIFKDLNRNDTLEEIKLLMKNHTMRGKELFISPAYDIQREFRCYFTKNNNNIEIFSIKQRINSFDDDIYSKDNIQIYKNISVKWEEVETSSSEFEVGVGIAKDIVTNLSYDTGCVEFASTPNGIIFFEVNQMAGPLPFEGKDTENMTKFYHSIFDKMFEN